MAHPDRLIRQPLRLGPASLTAVAALLAAGTALPASAATEPSSADGGAPAAVSTLSGNRDKPGTMSFLPDGRSALVTERPTHHVFRLGLDGSRTPIGTVPHVDVSTQEPHTHTTADETRVVRMSFDGTSLSGYTAVLDGIVRGTKHNGGKLAFGPDGYLYVATGDGHRNPQGLAWDRNGRLWRIPIDGDTECAGTKTGFYEGEFGKLRAPAKVPGADELWLGTSDRGGDTDEILRITT